MLTHLVLFKFKPDTTPDQIQQLADGLGALPEVIADIREFRFGKDVFRSERSFDFGLVSSFESRDALQRYQVHPEHQKVVAHVKDIAENVVVVDFED